MAPQTQENLDKCFVDQEWKSYTAEQHDVWRTLFERRMRELQGVVCDEFIAGCGAIGLSPAHVPDLRLINRRLQLLTGWQLVAVNGFLPAAQFFELLAQRRFPTTITLRTREQLEYLPEPDIFHDIFGHVPLLADGIYADFLQRFAAMASGADEARLELLSRIFWFTVEFGVMGSAGKLRVYGSGLVSSSADCAHALSPDCSRLDFQLDRVLAQDFATDKLQQTLFTIGSFDQLYGLMDSVPEAIAGFQAAEVSAMR